MIGFDLVPRYGELVKQLTGEEELVPPGLILEVDRPEYSYEKREFLWVANPTQAAVAAQNSALGIRNRGGADQQANQRLLVVINRITILGDNAAARSIVLTAVRGNTGFPASGTVPARDWRLGRRSDGTGSVPFVGIQMTQGTNAGIAGQILGSRRQPIGTDLVWDFVFVMSPFMEFTVWDNTVNEAMTATIEGYLRQARQEEIAPD